MVQTILGALAFFFSASIGPLLKRALVAIGIGTITYTGMDVAFGAARDLVISNYGAMGAATAGLVSLAGVGQAFGIILGALSARVGLTIMSKLGSVL
jgi:hypothetical protein